MAEVGREGVRLGSYFPYQDKSFSCMTPETWAGSVSVSTWMPELTLLTLPIFPTAIFYFFVTYVNCIVFLCFNLC